jgi:hypothetical protein
MSLPLIVVYSAISAMVPNVRPVAAIVSAL